MQARSFLISFLIFSTIAILAQNCDPNARDINSIPSVSQIEQYPIQSSFNRTGEEWRAFWVDGWNRGFLNAVQVSEMVKIASDYGYNAIVVQVRRRGDAIYFPTYPNTEPRLSVLSPDFDALQEIIVQAHARRLEVHAWITTFLISTTTPPIASQHVFHTHPEYLTQNFAGEKKIAEGYYLDPGNPDALEWNSRVVRDLTQHYDIDGIHFDYVRYPICDSGYNPAAIERYNREFGLTGKPDAGDERFSVWRRRQITDWLRSMYVEIIAIKPHVKVTAATFANRSDAYYNRFQDWAQWMNEKILDANLPMNYSVDFNVYRSRCDEALRYSYGRHVYMGVGAYLLKPEDTVTQLLYARDQNSSGLLLFSYANNNKGGDWLSTFDLLRRQVFPIPAAVPPMIWKTSPTFGYVFGKVSSKSHGVPLYNAQLAIPTLNRQTKTDSHGNFAFIALQPGNYDLFCQGYGFETQKQEITIKAGAVAVCDIALSQYQLPFMK